MDPKYKSSVTHTRQTCVCDYCGLKLKLHNLKAHMQNTLTYMLLRITSWLCNMMCRLLTITCLELTTISWLHTFTYNFFLAALFYMLAAH